MNLIKDLTKITGQDARKAFLPVDSTWYKAMGTAGAIAGAATGYASSDEDDPNKLRNTLIGAGAGAGLGLAGTKAFYAGRMAVIPKPKGKVLLASDDKYVTRLPNGNVHILYPDKTDKRQLEMTYARKAAELGVAPPFISGQDKSFVQGYGGESLLSLVKSKKITPEQARLAAQDIARKEKVLRDNNIYHGDLNPGNVTIPDINKPDDVRFIDYERSFDPTLRKDIPEWQRGFGLGKNVSASIDPEYVTAMNDAYKTHRQELNYSYMSPLASFGLRSGANQVATGLGLKEWYLLGKPYGTHTRNRYLTNTAIGSAIGGGLGALVPTEDSEGNPIGLGNRLQNAAIGAGLGGTAAIVGTRQHYRNYLNRKVPGKELSSLPHKKVVLSPDESRVTTVYGKSRKDVLNEINATRKAAELGISPELISHDPHSLTLGYGGKNVHDLVLEGKLTPEQLTAIGKRSAEYDSKLRGRGVGLTSLHTKNMVMTDPTDINTLRFIDYEGNVAVNPKKPGVTKLGRPFGNKLTEEQDAALRSGYEGYTRG